MAVNNRLDLSKASPGANASGLLTSVSGLILNGVAVVGKLVLATPYTITTPDALVDFGIDAAYDEDNEVLVYHQITEFFRMSEPGVTLHFMVVAQSVTPAVLLEDTGNLYAKKLLIHAQGEIYQLGICYNPDTATYTETLTDGFNTDIRAAIPKAKLLKIWAAANNMPLSIVLEGRKYSGNSSACVNLRDIQISGDTISYEGIVVVIGQDYDFAETLWAMGKFYGAVGTFLGTVAGIFMEQDAGEVETLDITNVDLEKMVVPGLSSHVKISNASLQLDQLDDKGYIFPIKYVKVSGHRWNGDHVCAPVIIDANGVMNEFKLSYGRTMDATVRTLYTTLIPKVHTTHAVDEQTGKLPLAKIKYFEALGDAALKQVRGLSGGKTYVDPDSDLFTPPQVLNVAFTAVPFGTIGKIKGVISLKNKL